MANNVLKSWLGGFQTPTPIPRPTSEPTPAPTSYQRSIDNIKRLLPRLTDAQARDYATQEQILTMAFHQGGFSPRDYVTRLQALYNKFAAYGWPKPTLEPTPTPTPTPEPTPTPVPIPTPRPTPRPYPTPAPRPTLPEDWQAQKRARRWAEWLRRRQTPTQVLSNYPRLPQSTIPEPKVEYPAPGRPSKYRNPFAWRRPKSSWW